MPTNVGELAERIDATVHGDASLIITAVRELRTAGCGHLSFLTHPRYLDQLQQTEASAILVREPYPQVRCTQLQCKNPYLAMAQACQILHAPPAPASGIAQGAHVNDSAHVDPGACVRPGAVVEAHARIASGCVLHPGAYVGRGATLGPDCILHPGAKVLDGCILHARVILQAGAIVGSDGFGYAQDGQGRHHKIPQMGHAVLEDDVEIGANSCVDRATFCRTLIGAGTKIDNLVQVAHNVSLGRDCIVVSQAGIAGSTKVGDRVMLGAQSGLSGHLEIASNTLFAARAGVIASIKSAGTYGGFPAMPHDQWLKMTAHQRRLGTLRQRVQQLETTHNSPSPAA